MTNTYDEYAARRDADACRTPWHRVNEQGDQTGVGLTCDRRLGHHGLHHAKVDGEPRPAEVRW